MSDVPALSIAPLDHRDPAMAALIHAILMPAYAQEAALLGVTAFAPLQRTVDDLRADDDAYLGAFLGTRLVASLSIGPDTDAGEEDAGQWLISSLVVQPEFQRRGIARTLLGEALRAGAGRVFTVTTGLANAPALALYQGLGFVPYRLGTAGSEELALVKLRRGMAGREAGNKEASQTHDD